MGKKCDDDDDDDDDGYLASLDIDISLAGQQQSTLKKEYPKA